MSWTFPPGFNLPPIILPPPSPVYWPPPSNNDNTSKIAGVIVAFGVAFIVFSCACKVFAKNREDAQTNGAGAPNTALAAQPPRASSRSSVPPPVPRQPDPWYGEQELWRPHSAVDNDEGRRPRRVSPAAGLPSFPYNRSVRHNDTGGGRDEEASCSVCLGAFQTGEMVRLLPVCLHLFHVECIDPWLDMHSTCPICRSGTDPTTDGRLYPPV